jgi:hypothetical protein
VSGRAVVLSQRAQVLRYRITEERLEQELGRLERARVLAREQLTAILKRLERRRGPELASLFDAQILMLDDPMLIPRAADLVRQQQVNAEWALQQVFEEFSTVFDEVADPYLRERKGDVADLVGRLRMNLRHGVATTRDLLSEVDEASVLNADELTPSLAAQIDWTKVRGFATDTLMQRIALRDRPYERQMERSYINDLNIAYEEFFSKSFDHTPVLVIDSNKLNVVQNPEDLKSIENRIRQSLSLPPFQQALPLPN